LRRKLFSEEDNMAEVFAFTWVQTFAKIIWSSHKCCDESLYFPNYSKTLSVWIYVIQYHILYLYRRDTSRSWSVIYLRLTTQTT